MPTKHLLSHTVRCVFWFVCVLVGESAPPCCCMFSLRTKKCQFWKLCVCMCVCVSVSPPLLSQVCVTELKTGSFLKTALPAGGSARGLDVCSDSSSWSSSLFYMCCSLMNTDKSKTKTESLCAAVRLRCS